MNSRPGVTATTDMAVLPGVLGYSFDSAQDRLPLRRTVQVRLGFDFGFGILDLGFLSTIDDIELTVQISPFVLWFSRAFQQIFNPQSAFRNRRPGGTTIFVVSRQQFMKCPG